MIDIRPATRAAARRQYASECERYHARPQQVLVLLDAPSIKSAGGVDLPEMSQTPVNVGTILDVGSGVPALRVGTRVHVNPFSSPQVREAGPEGSELVAVEAADVLAAVDDPLSWGADYTHRLPANSYARRLSPAPGHILIRNYRPQGFTPGGLYAEKDDRWPRIWAWILGIQLADLVAQPELQPGRMAIYRRYADEQLGTDPVDVPLYLGETLDVSIVNIKSCTAVMWPAPAELLVR